MAGEVLEGGQDTRRVHAADEGARVGGDLDGIARVRPSERDHGGIVGIEAHVDHGGEVPVDPRLAESRAEASGLLLGHGEVLGLAEVLRGRGWRVTRP